MIMNKEILAIIELFAKTAREAVIERDNFELLYEDQLEQWRKLLAEKKTTQNRLTEALNLNRTFKKRLKEIETELIQLKKMLESDTNPQPANSQLN